MRKFFFFSLFCFLFLGVTFSGFSEDEKTVWLESSKIGVRIETGAHILFQRDYEGFISNENGLFLYVTSLQPETYEEMIRSLNFSTDKERLTAAVSALKEATGLPYVILPAKNYDGFCFWDSSVCDYNIKDHTETGADWLRTVTEILKANRIRVGFGYSIIDWHHPSQIQYKKDGSRYAVKMNTVLNEGTKEEYIEYMTVQLKELIVDYGADMIFFDGDWAPWWSDGDAEKLLRQMYAWNPDLIVNNYLGNRKKRQWGDFDVYKTVVPSDRNLRERNRPWVFSLNTFSGVDQINNRLLYKKGESFIDRTLSVWEKGGSVLISLDVMSDAIVSDESLALAQSIGDWFRINSEIFSGTEIVTDDKILLPETVLFCGSGKTYCLQKSHSLWPDDRDPLKLKIPSSFTDKKVKAAWLLTKEGKVGLSPVAGRDGETLGFGLSPQYRDLYFSLMMPVYGFEY